MPTQRNIDNAIVCAPKTELKYKSRLRQHFEQNIIFHILSGIIYSIII